MQLQGKAVLITGGRRIGSKLALMLADRKARLALTYYQSRERIEATADEVRQRGADCLTDHADLREPADVDRVVERVVRDYGRLDVLVNMTSIYQAKPLAKLEPADFDDAIASNLRAPYLAAVAAGRQMLSQLVVDGLRGKIVNIADWSVERPYRGYLPYLIAKGGVVTLTRALAVELAPTITVNAVAPGTVEPPPDAAPETLERIRNSSALERLGSADDVNRLILYLLEGTDYATGEVYRVDGGRFLGRADEGAQA